MTALNEGTPLATSTLGLTRPPPGCAISPDEFMVDGEQECAFLWAKVRIGVDGLSNGRSAVITQFIDHDVSERTRQCAWTYAQAPLRLCDCLGWWCGLASQPLRYRCRRETQLPSQGAAGHTSVFERLPQRFTKRFPLLGCSHSPDAPSSVSTWQQACPIRQRLVDTVACQLTPDSYQATFVRVAASASPTTATSRQTRERPYGSAATDDSCRTKPACTAGRAHDACAARRTGDDREGSRILPRQVRARS